MTDLRELLRPRVERGAALLDSVEPYWWKRVNKALDFSDCERDVLGQVYGHYYDGVAALFRSCDVDRDVEDVASEHGFGLEGCEIDVGSNGPPWGTLDALWLEAIEARRRNTPRPRPLMDASCADNTHWQLPHAPDALLGKHVRIVRRGRTYEGTVTSAGPYKSHGPYFTQTDLALIVHMDGEADASGFWLPPDATVELLDGES